MAQQRSGQAVQLETGDRTLSRDVSCIALGYYWDYLDRQGVARSALVHGLPYSLSHLQRRWNWIDFDTLLELERRFSALFPHQPDVHYQLGRGAWRNAGVSWISVMMRTVVTPAAAYRLIPRVAHWLFPFVTVSLQESDARRLRLTYTFAEDREPSEAFLQTVHGVLTGLPEMVGDPPAAVQLELQSRRVVHFEVTLAEFRGGMAVRLGRLARRLLPIASQRLLDELSHSNTLLRDKVESLSRAEQQLRLANWRLQREMAQRQQAEEQRQRLQQQLQQVARLEALGRLAGGVAHDMNNVLAAVLAHAQMLRLELGLEGSQARADLQTIISACKRGRELTQGLVGFARKGRYQARALDLRLVVHEVCHLLRPTLADRVALTVELPERGLPVWGDPGQLHQVLMNVALNAVDAMPEGGELRLRASWVTVPEAHDEPRLAVLRPGPYVQLELRDTGCGMAPETRSRALEPFFTTKPVGDGTGLGLATAYGIMRGHQGTLLLDSELGQGTTVRLLLPPSGEEQAVGEPGVADEPLVPAELGQGRAAVVVDDEPELCEVQARLLAGCGFAVRQAASGEQALRLLDEQPAELVLLDMVMPGGMDGHATFHAMRALCPQTAVVLVSGYASQEASQQLLQRGARGFVAKPFTADELLRVVARALSAEPS